MFHNLDFLGVVLYFEIPIEVVEIFFLYSTAKIEKKIFLLP